MEILKALKEGYVYVVIFKENLTDVIIALARITFYLAGLHLNCLKEDFTNQIILYLLFLSNAREHFILICHHSFVLFNLHILSGDSVKHIYRVFPKFIHTLNAYKYNVDYANVNYRNCMPHESLYLYLLNPTRSMCGARAGTPGLRT